jgi:tetratricopeptide (TPR) repeat protein
VEIVGNKIDTGTYVIYTIPTAKDWTVIVNKGVKNWGSDRYRKTDDVCRFVITPERKRQPVETFAVQFENVKGETCDLTLQWEDWKLSIPIVALLREPLRKQIEENLKSDKPIYWFAAQFYYEYERDNEKALTAIAQAIEANEKAGRKPYWQYFYKARILKDLGRKKEAMEMANLTRKYAKEHGNRTNYVQQSEDLISSLE